MDPVDGVGVVAEYQDLAAVAFVAVADRLASGLGGYGGQLVAERCQCRVGVLSVTLWAVAAQVPASAPRIRGDVLG